MTSSSADDDATIIIGGGITGAAALHWLAAAGHDVALFETGERLGGVIGSGRSPIGALVETGPNSIHLSGTALPQLIDELGLRDELTSASPDARKRFIVRDGRVVALPLGPLEALRTPLLSLRGKLRLLREPWVVKRTEGNDESVADFVMRRMGREALDYLVNPFFSGIYAGRPESLSVRSAMGMLHELENTHGSVARGMLARRREASGTPRKRRELVTFREGMSTLPRRIESRWRERIHVDARIDAVERIEGGWRIASSGTAHLARRLVIATSAPTAAALLASVDTRLADVLRSIEYPPVATVVSVYSRASIAHPLDGFGLLVPEVEGRRILGIVFNSTVFAGRAPHDCVVVTTFVGGARQPQHAFADDREIALIIAQEHRELLGASAEALETTITRWSAAIPQYRVGYDDVLDELRAGEERHPGLYLAGSYRGGVAVGDCVASAQDLAHAIVQNS